MKSNLAFLLASSGLGALLACGGSPQGGQGGAGATSADTTTSASGPTTTTTTTATTTTATTGTGGANAFVGTTRVSSNATAVAGSADVAIAPDGSIYVSWVDKISSAGDVFVAKSTDGGKTFSKPVQVDDANIVPLVSMARHPYVVADNARVAVIFNDMTKAYLYTSPANALAFGAPAIIGADIPSTFYDFPKAIFLSDGSLAVAFHGYPQSGAKIYFARESNSFASEDASGGAPGLPCECCPLDAIRTSAGDLTVAFRNNNNNIREMWASTAPAAAAFSVFAPISTTEGQIDQCPMQGPRMVEKTPGTLLSVWSVRGANNTGSVVWSTSTDGGKTWSGGAPTGFVADEPTIALGAAGHLYVTGVTGAARSQLITSTDDGASWSAPAKLAVADGTLGTPQVKGTGGIVAMASVSSMQTVWLDRRE